jgi:predicted DNA-binding helix-hairpin-helix protein
MDVLQKLELIGGQMGLEPAEDADAVARPSGFVPLEALTLGPSPDWRSTIGRGESDPGLHGKAPCGHSPAELQSAMNALTKNGGDPAPGLERKKHSLGISHAVLPGGRRMPMLKTLLTSACERNCYYCPFRAGRNFRRATFKPEEMASVYAQMHQAGMVEGMFLSSGIAGGGVRTQDRLIDTIEILRRRHEYRGFVHLKLMPGLEREQVLRSMQLADRISINLEAPNTARLARLAPRKIFLEELLQPLKWAHEIRLTQLPHTTLSGRWPSLVTQLVVGAVGEDDLEILTTTSYLTKQLRLGRVYFSAFHPVPDTPLENHAPENPWREHRLYQASFLLRDYGFELEDMPFTQTGRLPLEVDPKLAWAQQNLNDTPLELNRADKRELLRIPGIGPKGAESIIMARRQGTLRELRDLRKLGILVARAAPFILLNGRQPAYQLPLV